MCKVKQNIPNTPLNCCKSAFLRYIVMATTHLGSRHCITFAILVDRCNYSEFYFDVVNTKSTKLNRTLLKSIKDFNPKLHSYP